MQNEIKIYIILMDDYVYRDVVSKKYVGLMCKNSHFNYDSFENFKENKNVFIFDKNAEPNINENNDAELKKIIKNINKSQEENAYLITNKKDIFEFINRKIYFKKYYDGRLDEDNFKTVNLRFDYHFNFYDLDNLRSIFINNIENTLIEFGKVFDINIVQLVKGTTYKVTDKNELFNLINEDLDLIISHSIITSRLLVIFYRLTYFDINASKVYVGRYFSKYFGTSDSFCINLNRNTKRYFFTDLNNKNFRGYKIKPLDIKLPDNEYDLKIKIAKRLLSAGVKLKIVAEATEISEIDLKNIVYGYSDNKEVCPPIFTNVPVNIDNSDKKEKSHKDEFKYLTMAPKIPSISDKNKINW